VLRSQLRDSEPSSAIPIVSKPPTQSSPNPSTTRRLESEVRRFEKASLLGFVEVSLARKGIVLLILRTIGLEYQRDVVCIREIYETR
jgi:hypothetical protein